MEQTSPWAWCGQGRFGCDAVFCSLGKPIPGVFSTCHREVLYPDPRLMMGQKKLWLQRMDGCEQGITALTSHSSRTALNHL